MGPWVPTGWVTRRGSLPTGGAGRTRFMAPTRALGAAAHRPAPQWPPPAGAPPRGPLQGQTAWHAHAGRLPGPAARGRARPGGHPPSGRGARPGAPEPTPAHSGAPVSATPTRLCAAADHRWYRDNVGADHRVGNGRDGPLPSRGARRLVLPGWGEPICAYLPLFPCALRLLHAAFGRLSGRAQARCSSQVRTVDS